MGNREKLLLVGDNPFHGVSHLSQERARARHTDVGSSEYAADLIAASLANGADGFLFTVSDTTLSILRAMCRRRASHKLELYAIAPYAYEYVRLAVATGGIPGLARTVGGQIVLSGNWRAIFSGLRGVLRADPAALLNAYLSYEVSRIRSASRGKVQLVSVLLHELVTDMALALGMDWLFRAHIQSVLGLGARPGFDTRNFSSLVGRFKEWGMDLRGLVIAAPFNALGFQMSPSKEACEQALSGVPEATVLGFSLLAAGYLKPQEAAQYVRELPALDGVAVGVSRTEQALETFRLLRDALRQSPPDARSNARTEAVS